MQQVHRISHNDSSILSVAVSSKYIFAGTQTHHITVHDRATYTHQKDLKGHNGAVLSLLLSPDESKLFSSSGDSLVKIWCTTTFECLAIIYSAYDIGDVFSTAYSKKSDTLYLGAQNTSLQWISLKTATKSGFPTRRPNKFFDSVPPERMNNLLEIDKENIVQYAHYSYVYTLLLGTYRGQEVLFTGGGDAAVNIWSLPPKQISSLCQSSDPVLSLAQQEFLYVGHSRGTVAIWDLETNQLLRRIKIDGDVLALGVYGDFLLTAGSTLKVWSGADLIEEIDQKVLCMAQLITGGDDITVWSLPATAAVEENDAFMSALAKFVSFESTCDNYEGCRRAAHFLLNLASDLGAESSLIPTDHNPIVLIKFKGTTEQSILYYGHYDVVGATDGWTTSPWTLTGRDGYLYGRGVSDNKAPILAAIFAAHELTSKPNITFLIEGEEEMGSRGFKEAITKELGHFDQIFLSNSYWLDDHTPCLTYGLRGVIKASITVSNDLPDLHSGVEGGSIREPTVDLVNLLSTLTHDGRVMLPGFYNSVQQDERRFYEDINTRCGRDIENLMNKWCRPSLTIHKITAGTDTVISHSATANISIRTVPDQKDVADTLIAYLHSKFNSSNKLTIEITGASDWWLGSPTSQNYTTLAKLIHAQWNIAPLLVREGGSIPMVKYLEQEFNASAIHFPMGQASDQAHLKNERIRITNLQKGRQIMYDYFLSSK